MYSKSLLIAIAALALTTTNAQAFNADALVKAGLSSNQQAAFVKARTLRKEGDINGARDLLVNAGIDETVIEKVRSAVSADKKTVWSSIKTAVDTNDYQAFKNAVVGTPLADIITTESDFVQFREAQTLLENKDRAGAKVIFDKLGVPHHKNQQLKNHWKNNFARQQSSSLLTDAQKQALQVAKSSNDKDAMEAIYAEAGIDFGGKNHTHKFLKDGRELDN